MNIFYNRPLFTSCMMFLGVSAVSYFIPKEAKLIISAVFAIVFIVSLFMSFLSNISVRVKVFLLNSVMCSLSIVLATVISLSYFNANQERFDEMYGKEYTVEVTVLSKSYESEHYCSYDVLVNKVNGEEMSHNASLTCEYHTSADVGETIIVKATAQKPEDNKDGIFNEKLMMMSDGKFIRYTSYDDVGIIITEYVGINVKILFAKLNNAVSKIITDRVDGEAANLSSAILLGNKDLLSGTTQRDFARAGVSHILALSGMHMTIILGAFTAILWLFTKNTKKIGVIASIAAVFYLALTGFSISATRAVLMLLIVYFCMIILNEPDPLTSLSISGFLIVVMMPGATLDAGFWMSFSATLGLLVFMPPLHEYLMDKLYSRFLGKSRRVIVKSILFVTETLVASVFAIIPLIVVMCVFIKEMSWFSIISSAVLALPSSGVILLSLLLVCFFYVPHLSTALIFLIESISGFMIDFCADISVMKNVVFSLNYPFINVAAIVIGIALLYSFVSNHKKKPVSLIPFACSIIMLVTVIGIYEKVNEDTVKATYINASSVSDMIVLSSEKEVVICDLSNGSKTSYAKALDEVYESRATEIRAIMMTGYTYAHAATFSDVFAKEIVREIWLPEPETIDEYYKMKRIYEVAQRFGVSSYIYGDGDSLGAFDNTVIQVYQARIKRSAVPITAISIHTSTDRMVYLSHAFNESKIGDFVEDLFAKSRYVVFGNKGPRVKKSYTIENNLRIDAIAFSDNELVTHFDPAEVHGSAYFYVPNKIEFYLVE